MAKGIQSVHSGINQTIDTATDTQIINTIIYYFWAGTTEKQNQWFCKKLYANYDNERYGDIHQQTNFYHLSDAFDLSSPHTLTDHRRYCLSNSPAGHTGKCVDLQSYIKCSRYCSTKLIEHSRHKQIGCVYHDHLDGCRQTDFQNGGQLIPVKRKFSLSFHRKKYLMSLQIE